LADAYFDYGDINLSFEILTRIDTLSQSLLNHNPVLKILIHYQYSKYYNEIEDLNKVLPHLNEAKKQALRYYGKYNLTYYSILISLSDFHLRINDPYTSNIYENEMLKISDSINGTEDKRHVIALINIAYNHSELGDHGESIYFYNQCLKWLKGKEELNDELATVLSNLASEYNSLSLHKKALDLTIQSLKIKEYIYGSNHPDYAITLYQLARTYIDLSQNENCLSTIKKVIKINENYYGKNNSILLDDLTLLAEAYGSLGKHNKQFKVYEKSLDIIYLNKLENSQEHAVILNNYSLLLLELGLPKFANEKLYQSLQIRKDIFGKYHENYILSMRNLAYVKLEQQDSLASDSLFLNSFNIECENFLIHQHGISFDDKLSYKKQLDNEFNKLIQYAQLRINTNPSLIHSVYKEWLVINKSLSTNESNLSLSIHDSKDSLLINKYNDWKENKMLYSNAIELTSQERNKGNINLASMAKIIKELEIDLSFKSSLFSRKNTNSTIDELLKNITNSDAFIDILKIPMFDFETWEWKDSTIHVAFIVTSENGINPEYINLGYIGEEVIQLYNSSIKKSTNQNSDFVFNSLWKEIGEKIINKKTIYISLGGLYNKININTLYNPITSKYLIEEKDIRIINSAHTLIENKESKTYINKTATIVGFPNFNDSEPNISDSLESFAQTRNLNSFWIDSLSRGNMSVSLLPGTKIEAENISTILNKNLWDVKTLTGINASESQIKKITSPRLLHIATHGYFFEDVPIDTENNQFMGMDRNKSNQNPMLRSGLLFTGANKTLKGEHIRGENGLLSAYEASLLDLRNTELVVLSACETGRGEIKNSEGVYGLRKAISDAGAANTIMSLWKVDDKVTQVFMTTFYSTWLSGKTIREAFNETQLIIKEKYPQPYYWGAFVLVGK